jgi:hypothetical protein
MTQAFPFTVSTSLLPMPEQQKNFEENGVIKNWTRIRIHTIKEPQERINKNEWTSRAQRRISASKNRNSLHVFLLDLLHNKNWEGKFKIQSAFAQHQVMWETLYFNVFQGYQHAFDTQPTTQLCENRGAKGERNGGELWRTRRNKIEIKTRKTLEKKKRRGAIMKCIFPRALA